MLNSENKTHKFLWDFEIQTDYLISDRSSYQALIDEKKELVIS